MSLHPTLERVQAELLERRASRDGGGYQTAGTARHEPLKVAYRGIGEGQHLRILYCPGCLRGHVVDLVSELPADAPNAQELGLRQLRPWRLECPDKTN